MENVLNVIGYRYQFCQLKTYRRSSQWRPYLQTLLSGYHQRRLNSKRTSRDICSGSNEKKDCTFRIALSCGSGRLITWKTSGLRSGSFAMCKLQSHIRQYLLKEKCRARNGSLVPNSTMLNMYLEMPRLTARLFYFVLSGNR